MSRLVWAGVAIDPETQGKAAAESLNVQINGMIADVGEDPFMTIDERDGSQLRRYLFGRFTFTDIYDRDGKTRVGFGIEACSKEDALRVLGSAQELLASWDVLALASVWGWDRMTSPFAAPMQVEV